MPGGLGGDDLRKGLGPAKAQGGGGLPLARIHRVDAGADHLRDIDTEVDGEGCNGHHHSVQPGAGKDHIEQHHQQHQHRDSLNQTDEGCCQGGGQAVLTPAHHAQPKAKHRAEQSGEHGDDRRDRQTGEHHLPPVCFDEVPVEAIGQPLEEASFFLRHYLAQVLRPHQQGYAADVMGGGEVNALPALLGDADRAGDNVHLAALEHDHNTAEIALSDVQFHPKFLGDEGHQFYLIAHGGAVVSHIAHGFHGGVVGIAQYPIGGVILSHIHRFGTLVCAHPLRLQGVQGAVGLELLDDGADLAGEGAVLLEPQPIAVLRDDLREYGQVWLSGRRQVDHRQVVDDGIHHPGLESQQLGGQVVIVLKFYPVHQSG